MHESHGTGPMLCFGLQYPILWCDFQSYTSRQDSSMQESTKFKICKHTDSCIRSHWPLLLPGEGGSYLTSAFCYLTLAYVGSATLPGLEESLLLHYPSSGVAASLPQPVVETLLYYMSLQQSLMLPHLSLWRKCYITWTCRNC